MITIERLALRVEGLAEDDALRLGPLVAGALRGRPATGAEPLEPLARRIAEAILAAVAREA